MRFRRKPLVVEAIQVADALTRAKSKDLPKWLRDACDSGAVHFGKRSVFVRTSDGMTIAEPGDWIIRGVMKELCVCKPDTFEATYESL